MPFFEASGLQHRKPGSVARLMCSAFAAAALLAFAGSALAPDARAQTAPVANATASSDGWVDITPNAKNSDPKMVTLVSALRPDVLAYMQKIGQAPIIYAFETSLDSSGRKYVIARVENADYCGLLGCQTYIFQEQSRKDNTWRQVFDQNISYVVAPPDTARRPSPILRTLDYPDGQEEPWVFTPNGFARPNAVPLPGIKQ